MPTANPNTETWEVLTIDYQSPSAPYDFYKSLSQTGFAVISNHPIPYSVFEKVSQDWQKFFAQTEEEKNQHLFSMDNHSLGFYPFGSENAKGYKTKNLMEYYHYTPQGRLPDNMGSQTTQLYESLSEMALQLLHWLDATLPPPIKNVLSRPLIDMATTQAPHSLMRFIYYPPLTTIDVEEGAYRSAPHEDINLITLLCAATAPGLQVKDTQGNWHTVGTNFGEVVVNAGDMLQLATKNHIPSTTHQVANPTQDDAHLPRYSMPFFISCKPDVVLSNTMTADKYYRTRMQETGIIDEV